MPRPTTKRAAGRPKRGKDKPEDPMLEAPIDAAGAADGQSGPDGASDGAENATPGEQSEPRGPRREPMFEEAQDQPLVRREREPREERAQERERNGREDGTAEETKPER